MQNLAKRQWRPSLTLKESSDVMIDLCIKAREKNVLRKNPPKLYFSYVLEDFIPLSYMSNISSVFKYYQKDQPFQDIAKDVLLRQLSVALKTHFFFFENSKLSHEPYFFTLPSFENTKLNIFGLIYPIEKENKTIIVCEKDISKLFEKTKISLDFPVIVIEDSFKWYHTKNWRKIKEGNFLNYNIAYEEDCKKKTLIAKEILNITDLQKIADIVDVPYEIKDYIKPLGIEWNKKLKCWFLLKGKDLESIHEYIIYLKRQYLPNLK